MPAILAKVLHCKRYSHWAESTWWRISGVGRGIDMEVEQAMMTLNINTESGGGGHDHVSFAKNAQVGERQGWK